MAGASADPQSLSVPQLGTAQEPQLTLLSPPSTVESGGWSYSPEEVGEVRGVSAGQAAPRDPGSSDQFTFPASPRAGCSLVTLVTTET